ncbi:MAG: sterol-binding protein, partial [Hyphomicrobiaceae bacterium]
GQIARDNPGIFARLGPHQDQLYVIDPLDLPFALVLRPHPDRLVLRASLRSELPAAEARIAGSFIDLLRLIDSDVDGDAIFFSRELAISGNTEAIVRLRNALDDVDGSIAARVADLLGPPGRLALSLLRRAGGWQPKEEALPK